MTYKTIKLEQSRNIAIIRLDVQSKLNALSIEMIDEMNLALDQIEKSSRAFIITGAGRGFSSGWDLSGGEAVKAENGEFDAGEVLESRVNPLMSRLRNSSLPFITAVNGVAAGAGCSLALCGDMIVAAERAYFLQAFSRIGLVPDAGATHLLVRTIGRVRAMEMMLLADKLPAQKAMEWGLVNKVVPDADLEAEAISLVQKLADGPASFAITRNQIWDAVDAPWEAALSYERQAQRKAGRSSDYTEGVEAFLEKRPANFSGK